MSITDAEINGLRALVTGITNAMHGIIIGPLREDYATDEEHQAAYDDWYAKVHFWHATVRDVQ